MNCSVEERRSPFLTDKFDGDVGGGELFSVLAGSDEGWSDMLLGI